MDINYFDQIWNRKEIDKAASQAFWDSRAEEFNQRAYTDEGEDRLNKIFELLISKDMIKSGSDVLDIGCGPGKYAVKFANKVKSVTGIDISPKMIECANENAALKDLANTDFFVADWDELDIDSHGWNKKFDLVTSFMCPAVKSKAALEKMINASRGYCFLSNFVERRDEVKDYLSNYLVWQNAKNVHSKTIYCSFNILWLMGYHPEVTYIDTIWDRTMPIDKAADFYCANFEMSQKLSLEQKSFIHNYLEKIAVNGFVKETVKAKIAWMYWKV